MGGGTQANPYTREDVLRLIKENGGKAKGLDLSNKEFEPHVDLRSLDIHGIILRSASLEDAHLEKTILSGADLREAWLAEAHIEEADLEEASLQEAWLMGANLERAYLGGAHLEGSNLYFANLHGSYLESAEFTYNTKFENVNWGDYILEEEKVGYLNAAQETYRRLKIGIPNMVYMT
jgi:uncharacterized protein YjbI with pentapeptide repeats